MKIQQQPSNDFCDVKYSKVQKGGGAIIRGGAICRGNTVHLKHKAALFYLLDYVTRQSEKLGFQKKKKKKD